MRKILFRGKRVDNGEWVTSGTFYQCNGEIELWDEPNKDGYVTVIPETIGQFTGLTDKNGKKVFEGDIVAWKFIDTDDVEVTCYYLVEWNEKLCGFCMLNSFLEPCEMDNMNENEIVGNIHDNADLWKKVIEEI